MSFGILLWYVWWAAKFLKQCGELGNDVCNNKNINDDRRLPINNRWMNVLHCGPSCPEPSLLHCQFTHLKLIIFSLLIKSHTLLTLNKGLQTYLYRLIAALETEAIWWSIAIEQNTSEETRLITWITHTTQQNTGEETRLITCTTHTIQQNTSEETHLITWILYTIQQNTTEETCLITWITHTI